jgi:hypothetical protein
MTAKMNESPHGGRTGLSVWAENNQLAGTVAQLTIELEEAKAAIVRLQSLNNELLKDLRGKREAMAKVLDSYEINGENLGHAVRAALRHAKGGAS